MPFIDVTIGLGRSPEQIRSLIHELTEAAHRAIDARGRQFARARGVDAVRCDAERVVSMVVDGGHFDGVLSNFGGLNCVADLGVVASGFFVWLLRTHAQQKLFAFALAMLLLEEARKWMVRVRSSRPVANSAAVAPSFQR